jgi:ATP-dependent helicase HrpA
VPSTRVGTTSKADEGTRPPVDSPAVDGFRWLVDEFRVSLFAQELGTAEPVSTVKLDRALAARPAGGTGARRDEPPAAAPNPIVAAPVTGKKAAPIKNLGALDKLFPR